MLVRLRALLGPSFGRDGGARHFHIDIGWLKIHDVPGLLRVPTNVLHLNQLNYNEISTNNTTKNQRIGPKRN